MNVENKPELFKAQALAVDSLERADDAAREAAEAFDSKLWSYLARMTGGASPVTMATAWYDWLCHRALSPGENALLLREAAALQREIASDLVQSGWPDAKAIWTSPKAQIQKQSLRTVKALGKAHDRWTDWLTQTAQETRGVSHQHRAHVAFSLEQMMEARHPRNFPMTNPEALKAARKEYGSNFFRGWHNLLEDVQSWKSAELGDSARAGINPPEVGESLAVTPGKVVYRNRLIELIEYTPQTPNVHAEPLLMVPAWIMKYYILDLKPGQSLIEYMVQQGFQVFAISWRDPGTQDRDLAFDDYRTLGVLAALEAIEARVSAQNIHALGYCLGGTLLSVTAAAMARDGDDRLASLTLLAAQTDFSDPGELSLFIDEAQLAALDAAMEKDGYLDGNQMASAFVMLRAKELYWRRLQDAYYLGKRNAMNDLMTWNADVTRMPQRMHSEYLRHFFLGNDFAQGRFVVDGRPVAVSDIRAPIFALGTVRDHVAPWHSVYKIHLMADTQVTFTLVNGGHNAGVVSAPSKPGQRHQTHTKEDAEHYLAPDHWTDIAEMRRGSWWVSWRDWLEERSGGDRAATPPARAKTPSNILGEKLVAAPGTYIRSSVQ